MSLFNEIKENVYIFRLLIEAKVPNNYILSFNDYSKNIYEINSVKDRYYVVAFCSFIKEISIDWFKHGMQETPEELADIVMEFLHL